MVPLLVFMIPPWAAAEYRTLRNFGVRLLEPRGEGTVPHHFEVMNVSTLRRYSRVMVLRSLMIETLCLVSRPNPLSSNVAGAKHSSDQRPRSSVQEETIMCARRALIAFLVLLTVTMLHAAAG